MVSKNIQLNMLMLLPSYPIRQLFLVRFTQTASLLLFCYTVLKDASPLSVIPLRNCTLSSESCSESDTHTVCSAPGNSFTSNAI